MTGPLLWTLVAFQLALGLFDTLYHHELTERLAWRATAEGELRLHAVRNWLYGALFVILAWSEPGGLLAVAVLAVLAAEVAITLWDFVEEDLTRRLPASERITHTLLALNYGAILAMLVPAVLEFAGRPTGLAPVSYGMASAVLSLAALGVGLFGLRDWLASGRAARLTPSPAGPLASALTGRKRILVTGGTGFIGERLVAALAAGGHDVIALVRSREKAAGLAAPVTLVTSLAQIPASARLDAIINLAGAPIAAWPWTRSNRHRILRSRLKSTRGIVRLVSRLEAKPAVLISGSAIGFYPHASEESFTEADRPGRGFAARLCKAWEAETARARAEGVRVVHLRTGLVLGHEGGILARLLPAIDLGLGGPMGDGRQWMSWITRDDLVRLIVHAMATPDVEGALNATAPHPVRNAEFVQVLGQALHRPALIPAPAWPLRRGLGALADELLLSSQRVLPVKALASGFEFTHPDIDGAIDSLFAGRAGAGVGVAGASHAPSATGASGDGSPTLSGPRPAHS
jgi:hypothetical protein